MKNIWDEEAIRKEMERLDALTGLSGAKLPIKLTDGEHVIGCYHGEKDGRFTFSKKYFFDPEWAEEEALDTIRHEYAHYMDHMLYGIGGHGTTWKMCCAKVGASPVRCYREWKNDYYNNKRAEKERTIKGLLEYKEGDCILHPKYGKGIIIEIAGEGVSQTANIEFDSVGMKTLSLAWIHENCKKK